MELNEKLNKAYQKDKKAFEKVAIFETEIENLKKELKKESRAKEDAQIRKIRAHEDKDKAGEKNADDEIKKIDEKIKEIKEKVQKRQEIFSKAKEKVDAYINELNKDPEFEEQVNSILEKKYNRERKRVFKEKEQTDLIIDLCEKHPSLEMNLKGMIRASEEKAKIKEQWKKIDNDLKALDPIKDKVKIEQIKNIELPTLSSKMAGIDKKRDMNEKSFMDFCQKNNVAIDKEFLKKLIEEKSFAHDKGTGEIKALTSLKKISRGYDRQIKNFEKSIEKIPGAQIDNIETQTKGKGEEKAPASTTSTRANDNLPDKTYKWWQIKEKFNAWREKRRVEKEAKQQEQNNEEKNTKKENKFKDAYKYDVVKDYIEKRTKEIYQESAKETREEEKDEKEESER